MIYFSKRSVVVVVTAASMVTFAEAQNLTLTDNLIIPKFSVDVDLITLNDPETGFSDLKTMHVGMPFSVQANLIWAETAFVPNSTNKLSWKMLIDGKVINTGEVNLLASRDLPSFIDAGNATVSDKGEHDVTVRVTLDADKSENSRNYNSFGSGVSFIPLVVVLLFAVTTHNVELSLGLGIFTGACLVYGGIVEGFKATLDVYILEAVADVGHGYVYLFTLFLSGMVGQIQKAGGLKGITIALKKFVKGPRSAQFSTYVAGLIIFFDDYANTLVAGMSMRPLSDLSMVSREKLAFIVDATAAPVASIVPISSWVGFEVSLIQAELDKILSLDPDPQIATSGFGVFLETIAYRYYAIFMLILMPLLILTERDMGPMLLAERRCRAQKRTDGGEGGDHKSAGLGDDPNDPEEDTPCRWWNMGVPVIVLVCYIFALLVKSGDDGTNTMSFQEKIESSDSYVALLWGTMASALTAHLFFMFQDKQDGEILWFNVKGYISRVQRFVKTFTASSDNEELEPITQGEEAGQEGEDKPKALVPSHPEILITWKESLGAFLKGTERIFPALVVLTLAWAMGAAMTDVGLDRYFGDLIVNGNLDYRWMPTISFVASMFVALATGTSWGTMTIMFPLLLVPSYIASDGNPTIFYSTTAGILAGAVAGDHASPISDTTVLAALASECQLLEHVRTQAPYVVVVTVWSILVGTIPAGMESFTSGVSILLGFIFMLLHTFFTSARILNETGKYDIFTEAYQFFAKDKALDQLRLDTKAAWEEEVANSTAPAWLPVWLGGGRGTGAPGADDTEGGIMVEDKMGEEKPSSLAEDEPVKADESSDGNDYVPEVMVASA